MKRWKYVCTSCAAIVTFPSPTYDGPHYMHFPGFGLINLRCTKPLRLVGPV